MSNIESAITYWSALDLGPRSKKALEYALANGFQDGYITDPCGSKHAAATYAMQLYCNAVSLMDVAAEDAGMHESYQLLAILMGLEKVRKDTWSYGSRLLYAFRASGISLRRHEVAAFLAQEGSWCDPAKKQLMVGNPLAVGLYCAHIVTFLGSLSGHTYLSAPDVPEQLQKEIVGCWDKPTPADSLEALIDHFLPACIAGSAPNSEVKRNNFVSWLRHVSNFYKAAFPDNPALNVEGGLAIHTFSVIQNLIQLAKPEDPAQMGRIVMAAVCQNLHLTKTVAQLPFGKGRLSLYMTSSFFEDLLPEEVAMAIDCHSGDCGQNPHAELQLMQCPLGIYLHIANVLATYLPNNGGGTA